MSENLRLFIAVELPEDLLTALQALQRDLRGSGLNDLRWVRPDGIHLTLKFLGETPAHRVEAIQEAMDRAVTGVPPHSLSLGALGSFGSRRSPRVLWVGLEGDVETLARLQQQVEREMERLGFEPEARKFSPHLTLARVRPETAAAVAPRLAQALESVRPPAGEIPVRDLSLMRSELKPAGAVYTCLFNVSLR
jgi:RNA 2',3'-cyclic 3'-phosphodiesterase